MEIRISKEQKRPTTLDPNDFPPLSQQFCFTLLCRHNLRLERTGNMEKQMAFLSARFIC